MSLRIRALALIIVSLVLTMLILFAWVRATMLRDLEVMETSVQQGFSRVEADLDQINKRRVQDAIAARIEGLAIKVVDWAQWDDAYHFIQNRNVGFIQSNLSSDILASMQLDHILFFDTQRRPVLLTSLNESEDLVQTVDPELLKKLQADNGLLYKARDTLFTGIIGTNQGILLFAAHPVIQTDGTGPVKGTVVFTKILDSAEVNKLAELTHIRLSIHSEPKPNRTSQDTTFLTHELVDIDGTYLATLLLALPRDVHKQGLYTLERIKHVAGQSLLMLVIVALSCGLVLLVAMFALLEWQVIRPVASLAEQSLRIGALGDFADRLPEKGPPEIRTLSKAINEMLTTVEFSQAEIAKRDTAMRLVLDAVPVGILVLDNHFRVEPASSRESWNMLLYRGPNPPRWGSQADPIAGRHWLDLLGIEKNVALQLQDFLEVLRQGLLPAEDMVGLNPLPELRLHVGTSAERELRISYKSIENQKILVLMEDISGQRNMERTMQRTHAELTLLKLALLDPEGLAQFFVEADALLHKIQHSTTDSELFSIIHTLRGSAASVGLDSVSQACLQLEKELAAESISPEHPSRLNEGIAEVRLAVVTARQESTSLLGQDFLKPSVRIDGESWNRLLSQEDLSPRLQTMLRDMGAIPASKAFARCFRTARQAAQRMDKLVQVEVKGEDTLVQPETALMLAGSLIHLVRNAVAHGIEMPDQRQASGKPPIGTVLLRFERIDGSLHVLVEDDGRGVDVQAVHEKQALAGKSSRGSSNENIDDSSLLAQLAQPGFSTRLEADELAGRGYGLDAVWNQIQELGGQLTLRNHPGQGCSFALTIPEH